MEQVKKPVADFRKVDGNVFNLIGIAMKAVKKHYDAETVKKFKEEVFQQTSYPAVIAYIGEYCEVRI